MLSAVFVMAVLAAGGTTASTAESGRVKRRLEQFGVMVFLKTSRWPLAFNTYGNWCGFGGSGDTVDAIDECCKTHDKCYDDLLNQKGCEALRNFGRIYTTEYKWSTSRGEIICNDKEPCAKKLCGV